MYTEEEKDIIVISSFDGFTNNMRHRLLASFVKNDETLIKTLPHGVYNKVKRNFFDSAYRGEVLRGLDARGIKCVTLLSDGYPELLKHIPDPPFNLYCRGNENLLRGRCFSIVGSRRTPPHTLKLCKQLAEDVSREFNVVTGIADGADSAAAEGALPSGKIISVFANGFDHIYPACNRQLAERIAADGLLVTEYAPQTAPAAYRFPVRNRIIAGISEGTLVVSAGKKSGALITANLAADYSRDVFAVPHSVGVTSGEGCNELIRKGAYLTENILDIFHVFGLDFKTPEKVELSAEESELLEAIKSAGEAFMPAVASSLGKAPFQLIPVVTSLEIKGLVVRLGGNRYSAVK